MRVDHSLAQRLFAHGVDSARRSLLTIADEAHIRSAVTESLRTIVADSVCVDGDEPRFERPCLIHWHADRAMIVMPTAEADSRPLPHAIVLHRTDDPHDADELAQMVDAASDALAALAVGRLAFFVHGPLDASVDATSDAPPLSPGVHGAIDVTPYKRYSAASIDRIRAAPRDAADGCIATERPANLDFYPEYEAMYASFWADHPALGAKIGIESRDALAEYAAHDGLRLLRVDGELAGVAGALRHAEYGLRGWRMRERVLAKRFRGEGLGTRTLRAFVESLDHEPGDLVWGTILPENQASRRSAERLGRIDVGGLLWVTRADSPR